MARTVVAPPLSVVKCLSEVCVWGFGVLFLSCACVCRCRGCCSLSVCVCVWPVDLFTPFPQALLAGLRELVHSYLFTASYSHLFHRPCWLVCASSFTASSSQLHIHSYLFTASYSSLSVCVCVTFDLFTPFPQALLAGLRERYTLLPLSTAGAAPHASFSHLGPYGASYYSYLWARSISIRVWRDAGFAESPLDGGAGRAWVERVLRYGDIYTQIYIYIYIYLYIYIYIYIYMYIYIYIYIYIYKLIDR